MKPIVTRSQYAKNCWLLWSEVTGSLPRPIVIGSDEPPVEAYILHCLSTRADVTAAERDLTTYPGQVIVCALGKDEEITIQPDDRSAIDEFWTRFGATGRLFGTVGDGATWMARQSEPATA